MASYRAVLDTGVTNNLERRVWEHEHSTQPSFTQKYRVNRLVAFETFGHIRDAIASENTITGWLRAKKLGMIETHDPNMLDLSER